MKLQACFECPIDALDEEVGCELSCFKSLETPQPFFYWSPAELEFSEHIPEILWKGDGLLLQMFLYDNNVLNMFSIE